MTSDAGHRFKGSVHFAACALASIMAAYNWLRFVETGRTTYLINGAVYTASVAFEVVQTRHHWAPSVDGGAGELGPWRPSCHGKVGSRPRHPPPHRKNNY